MKCDKNEKYDNKHVTKTRRRPLLYWCKQARHDATLPPYLLPGRWKVPHTLETAHIADVRVHTVLVAAAGGAKKISARAGTAFEPARVRERSEHGRRERVQ